MDDRKNTPKTQSSGNLKPPRPPKPPAIGAAWADENEDEADQEKSGGNGQPKPGRETVRISLPPKSKETVRIAILKEPPTN